MGRAWKPTVFLAGTGAVLAITLGLSWLLHREAVAREMTAARREVSLLADSRKSRIEAEVRAISDELLFWSRNPSLRQALAMLSDSWSTPDYAEIHAAVDPALQRFVAERGYRDVFLISPAGEVIYSAAQRVERGTRLSTGPSSETVVLAEAFHAALAGAPEDVALTDFATNSASADPIASFAATSMRDDGQLLGVLAFEVPAGRLDAIVRAASSLGHSYIVGDDLLVRSGREIKLRADTLSVRRALTGESGVHQTRDYRGARVVSAYVPLTVERIHWALVAEVDEAQVRERIAPWRSLLRSGVWVLGAGLTGAAAASVWLLVGSPRLRKLA